MANIDILVATSPATFTDRFGNHPHARLGLVPPENLAEILKLGSGDTAAIELLPDQHWTDRPDNPTRLLLATESDGIVPGPTTRTFGRIRSVLEAAEVTVHGIADPEHESKIFSLTQEVHALMQQAKDGKLNADEWREVYKLRAEIAYHKLLTGPERTVGNLAVLAARTDLQVAVVSPCVGNLLVTDTLAPGIRVRNIQELTLPRSNAIRAWATEDPSGIIVDRRHAIPEAEYSRLRELATRRHNVYNSDRVLEPEAPDPQYIGYFDPKNPEAGRFEMNVNHDPVTNMFTATIADCYGDATATGFSGAVNFYMTKTYTENLDLNLQYRPVYYVGQRDPGTDIVTGTWSYYDRQAGTDGGTPFKIKPFKTT